MLLDLFHPIPFVADFPTDWLLVSQMPTVHVVMPCRHPLCAVLRANCLVLAMQGMKITITDAMTTMAFHHNAIRSIPSNLNRSINLLLRELGKFLLDIRPRLLTFDKALYRRADRILIRPHLLGAVPIPEGV